MRSGDAAERSSHGESLLLVTPPDTRVAPDSRGALAEVITSLTSAATVEIVSPATAQELDEALSRCAGRRIVVVGTDRELHAVLASLYQHDDLGRRVEGRFVPGPILGFVPLEVGIPGTSALEPASIAFARTHGLPLRTHDALQVVLQGVPVPVDLITDDSGGIVATDVHLGAESEVPEVGARFKDFLENAGVSQEKLGKLDEQLDTLATAFAPLGSRLRVEVDGKVVNVRQRVLAVHVGSRLTRGEGSGGLDVVITRAVGGKARLAYSFDVLRRQRSEREVVERLTGHTVTVRSLRPDEPFAVSSDGSLEGAVRTRTWRLLPAAYQLLLPA